MGIAGRLAGVLVLLALLVFAGGCGSDSEMSSDETEAQRLYPRVHGPGREFLIRGGDNQVQFYGQEATLTQREAASRVIHAWMRARLAEDWKEDCRYLSPQYARILTADAERVSVATGEMKVTSCPAALALFGDEASGTSGNTLTGPIDSLRVRGNRAYAQWHGPEEDWILPLRNEDGQWKVESASPLERTK